MGVLRKIVPSPEKTVTGRSVVIYKKGTGRQEGCLVVAKELAIDSFRQNNILQAIATMLNIATPAKHDLQTNKFYKVQKINKNLYCQKFGKQIVGYVATKNDVVYHASTKDLANKGLENKIKLLQATAERDAHTIYSAEILHKKFGFCYQGMREFCEAADLDITGEYTVADLRIAAKRVGKDILAKYKREIKILTD